MRFNLFILGGIAALGATAPVLAGGRTPGSLLLFPEFDNRSSCVTVLTVTNTNTGNNTPANVADGSVKVEFVYIGKFGHSSNGGRAPVLNCLEFNRTELLTAGDTLSLLTSTHNPNQEQGFVYAFVKDKNTGTPGTPIDFDFLIGSEVTLESSDSREISVNAVSFLSSTTVMLGGSLKFDADNVRDLNGCEYEKAPGEILIPRFLGTGGPGGQDSGPYQSELILIDLTGGADFVTTADFQVFNDNEEATSVLHPFQCWERVSLDDIDGGFSQRFLSEKTNDDPDEIIGAPDVEAGWIRIKGLITSSVVRDILDPAVYAVLIERAGEIGVADLPFEAGTPRRGGLVPHGILGNQDSVVCPP